MSCRHSADACAALLSSCRPRTPSSSCLAGRSRKLSSAHRQRRRLLRQDRAGLLPPPSTTTNTTPYDARRTIYTEEGGKLRRTQPLYVRPFTLTEEPPKNLPPAPRVAVLGGGVTGLAAAYYLAQELPPRSEIVLYEADTQVGGWIRSERTPVDAGGVKGEVLFERGPRLMSMASMTGAFDKMVAFHILRNTGLPATTGNPDLPRFIYYNNQLTPVPPFSDPMEWFRNPLIREILPSAGFWYLANDVLGLGEQPPREDVSIADWIRRVYRTPKLEVPLSAMIHGVWGGDIHKLSAWSILGPHIQKARDREAVGLEPLREIRFAHNFGRENGMGESESPGGALFKSTRQLFFGRHGLESLPQALADSLGSASNVKMRLGHQVRELTYNGTLEQVLVRDSGNKVERFDKVISTLPAHQLSAITSNKLPELSSFTAATIMTVNIWYPYEGIVPRGLGYLIPDTLPFEDNPERGLGVFFDSHVGIGSGASPHDDYREPGTKLFVLLGGHYYDPNEPNSTQPPSEGQAIDQAKTLLERHLGIPRHTTCHATARLAPGCLPQHTVGHHARVSRLSAQLAQSFGNRLAAVGGSFGKPGVVPGLRAGWDAAFSVANEDFLANGLEDHTEETFLNPGWIGVGNEHE